LEISYFDHNNNNNKKKNAFLLSFLISCYLHGHPNDIYNCFKTYSGLNDKIPKAILTNMSMEKRQSCYLVSMRSWVQVLKSVSCRNAGKRYVYKI
jgi:hypothetical protein